MKVVVTGGAGFIGSHCVDRLVASGHDVVVVDDFSAGLESNLVEAATTAKKKKTKFEIVRADVTKAEFWEKFPAADAFLHLAAHTSVTNSVKDPNRDFATNITCIPAIVDWLIRSRVRFAIYANTAGALYGEAATLPADERTAILPVSPYGATKSFFETYLGAVCRARKSGGQWTNDIQSPNYFSWVSLRLANIYGPRQVPYGETSVIPIFIEKLAQGHAPTIFGDGKKVRDYVHVTDTVRAFTAALEKLQVVALDDSFNVATGVETRDIDVFDSVLDALQQRAKNGPDTDKCRKCLEVQEPAFAPMRAGEVVRSSLTNYKIQAFLNWKPEITFGEGILSTVHGYPLP